MSNAYKDWLRDEIQDYLLSLGDILATIETFSELVSNKFNIDKKQAGRIVKEIMGWD